jgi:hypothetical protein
MPELMHYANSGAGARARLRSLTACSLIYNRDGGIFRSTLWTAVSTDRVHWQLENELMGAAGFNFYAALAENQVLLIQKAPSGSSSLVVSTVTMP